MTEKTLYLHAGAHKTGSSALQNFFELNILRLKSEDFAYENQVNIKSEYHITSGNGIKLFKAIALQLLPDNEIDSLVLSYFGEHPNAICSSECFAEFDESHWKKLSKSLQRVDVKIKIIFYVRNVIPFLKSAYHQEIKRKGESRLFDEWINQGGWAHFTATKTLQIIADNFPPENIKVLHYDDEKKRLISSFFDILGVEATFRIDPAIQNRLVNRSLTAGEHAVLTRVNSILGQSYSEELSDLLIYLNPNPNAYQATVCINKITEASMLKRFTKDINWINKTFFQDKPVIAVLSREVDEISSQHPKIVEEDTGVIENQGLVWALEKIKASEPDAVKDTAIIEKQVLAWALKKIKTIQKETELRFLTFFKEVAMNSAGIIHPEIPADFDSIAYLLLNPDLIKPSLNPIKHYIAHGKQEGRAYKFLKGKDYD